MMLAKDSHVLNRLARVYRARRFENQGREAFSLAPSVELSDFRRAVPVDADAIPFSIRVENCSRRKAWHIAFPSASISTIFVPMTESPT